MIVGDCKRQSFILRQVSPLAPWHRCRRSAVEAVAAACSGSVPASRA